MNFDAEARALGSFEARGSVSTILPYLMVPPSLSRLNVSDATVAKSLVT